MHPQFVRLLQCPACKSDLVIHAFRASKALDDEVDQGVLVCKGCSLPYPVIGGIPRLLPNSFVRHPRFAENFASELKSVLYRRDPPHDVRRFEQLHALTARAFGYEWNTYKTTSEEEDALTFYWLTGADSAIYEKIPLSDVFTYYPTTEEVGRIDPSAIAGRRVLEVGCGMGKYLRIVSEDAAEVIGMDLSDSLHRARDVTSHRRNVHLVQGDILNPPLKRQSIDFVYSVGVLHHTPDCHRAFLRSAELVAPKGVLSVWLYPLDPTPGKYAEWVHWIQDDFLRPITCRMPLWALRRFCAGLGRLTFVRDKYVERYRQTGSRWALRVAMAAGAVAVGKHHDPEIAAFLNFDWYSPQYRSYHTEDQLRGWYQEAGFRDVRILPQRVSAIGRKA